MLNPVCIIKIYFFLAADSTPKNFICLAIQILNRAITSAIRHQVHNIYIQGGKKIPSLIKQHNTEMSGQMCAIKHKSPYDF